MWKPIKPVVIIFIIFLAFGIFQKILFCACYSSGMSVGFFNALTAAVWHGAAMDAAVAAYLTVVPLIIAIVSVWTGKTLRTLLKVYFAIAAALVSAITLTDLTLYSYWNFRLDATPVFYFTSSPKAALASARWWEPVVGLTATAAMAWALYKILVRATRGTAQVKGTKKRIGATAVTVVAGALLFVTIRGGFTVSTMNLSYAYFSTDTRLNHAAVNPSFSLLYSLTHQTDFAAQYRFMSDDEATALLAGLNSQANRADGVASLQGTLLRTTPRHIYLIILESFSAHLMPSLGGEPVAVKLDSLAREGILFTRFYASSFRTDRALPAILGAFPAQPSTSIMKFTDKTERLPGLASALAQQGYTTEYFYGGDANFTNMRAYLVNSGFANIVSDRDFTPAQRSGKWGAHDHLLFEKAFDRARSYTAPSFMAIQTSSSHEPFEVPYSAPAFADSPQKNAFAYTDSCLMAFVDSLRSLPTYDSTLIAIVPDHLGAWPTGLADPAERHHVPFVLCGGALNATGLRIDTPAGQTDIAPTIAALAGADTAPFVFGHDMFDPSTPHYTFFSEPSVIGLVTADSIVTVGLDAPEMQKKGLGATAEAYLMKLYDYIDAL